jgi:hypothetical protein
VVGGTRTANDLVSGDLAPRIEAEETDFGVRLYAVRETADGDRYLRLNNFAYPGLGIFSSQRPKGDGYGVNWHVPIDDTHHWKYSWTHSRSTALSPQEGSRGPYVANSGIRTDYTLERNLSNRYEQDRKEMEAVSFLGMGNNFNVHDAYATEGEGPIHDRTQEHLATGDVAIAMMRTVLLRAIQGLMDGVEPPLVIRREEDNHFPYLGGYTAVLDKSVDLKSVWKELAQFPY